MPDLMNTDAVVEFLCEIFKVKRRTVTEQWMQDPQFPKPAVVVSRYSKAWRRADIEAWVGLEVERG